jgi:aminocarboxymuconate-semialdehyde decarboxylase
VIIDMHAHIIPENFPDAAGRASAGRWPFMDHYESGMARVMIAGENFRTVHSGNWDVERRLQDMDAHGADAEAISPMPELMSYWFTPQDGLDFCRFTNEYIVKMCDQAPKRLFGLGIIPMQDPELAAKELESIKRQGLLGVEIGSNVLGKSLGEERFLGFFQEAERLGLSVFVHALHPTMMDRLLPSHSNPIGFPTDTALSIASVIGSGTAEKCPNLRLAWSHGGGSFPFMLARYQNAWSATWNDEPPPEGDARGAGLRRSMPHSPAELARRFYYDTLLFDHRAIRFLIDMMGASQVLVGTDYPYQPPERPCDRSLGMLNLPRQVHEDITWNNCFRFLGVEAPK